MSQRASELARLAFVVSQVSESRPGKPAPGLDRIVRMTNIGRIDTIWLNTRNDNLTNNWAYYRTRSIGGYENDPIEACLVNWPTFEDIDSLSNEAAASVWTSGITGLAIANETMTEFLKNKWGIDHSTSVCIGLIPRGC